MVRKGSRLNKDMTHLSKVVNKAMKGKLIIQIERPQLSHKPSEKLQELVKDCARTLGKAEVIVKKVTEQGMVEGFTDLECGQMVKYEMEVAGIPKTTIYRHMPASWKHQEKRHLKDFGSTVGPEGGGEEEPTDQLKQTLENIDWHQLDINYLGKLINHLTQVYNEKKGNNHTKKYQPSLDEVKQREDKVLSLVKEGVTRIADLVEQSGVPESAVRRYLKKAGYKVFAGMIDLGG